MANAEAIVVSTTTELPTPSGDSNLRLRGFVKNLTDEEYITGLIATSSVSINLLTMPWAPPRTWGLEAIWEF